MAARAHSRRVSALRGGGGPSSAEAAGAMRGGLRPGSTWLSAWQRAHAYLSCFEPCHPAAHLGVQGRPHGFAAGQQRRHPLLHSERTWHNDSGSKQRAGQQRRPPLLRITLTGDSHADANGCLDASQASFRPSAHEWRRRPSSLESEALGIPPRGLWVRIPPGAPFFLSHEWRRHCAPRPAHTQAWRRTRPGPTTTMAPLSAAAARWPPPAPLPTPPPAPLPLPVPTTLPLPLPPALSSLPLFRVQLQLSVTRR
jgi:hypothetical protein